MDSLPSYYQPLPTSSRSPSPMPFGKPPTIRQWRRRWPLVALASFVLLGLLWLWRWHYWAMNFVSYSLRPLYDHHSGPQQVVPHYHAPGLPADDAAACERHGWSSWPHNSSKVVDAIVFSVELDLLEIRLAELSPVISHMLILESTTTFTGLPKPIVLEPLLQPNATDRRFAPYLDKIRYQVVEGRALAPGEDPFRVEKEMRMKMTSWLDSPEGGVSEGDLIIMSDVDEIPSRESIALLSACDTPSPIHLAMSQHIYSFQHSLSPLPPSWRAKVLRYKPQTVYNHVQGSDVLLSDAGWHCSFCFKYLGDFVFKARGYSHTDRLRTSSHLLEASHIEEAVCKGQDFFGMLPEAYDWGTLLSRWDGAGPREAGSLPSEVVKGAKGRWSWLVEDGCNRRWELGDSWKFGGLRV